MEAELVNCVRPDRSYVADVLGPGTEGIKSSENIDCRVEGCRLRVEDEPRVPAACLAGFEVDACNDTVAIQGIRGAARVIEPALARRIRVGPERQEFERDRIEPVLWNCIVRKGC